MILDGTFAVGQVKAGRIRALAATTNRRITALPDVPTMQEAGIPDYHFSPWWAAYVPAGTPPAIVAKIEGWVGAISKTPEAAKFLDTMAALPVIGDAEWVRGADRERPAPDRSARPGREFAAAVTRLFGLLLTQDPGRTKTSDIARP